MIIAVVADSAAQPADWSRDPRTLADGLRELGHQVVAPGPELTWPVDAQRPLPHFPARPDVVLSLGPAAPPVAAVLAETLGVPLALMLPPGLTDPDTPPGYARLLAQHLPAALLIAESERHADVAIRAGADPHRTVVVAPGLRLDPFTAPPAPGGEPLRLLCDLSRTPPGPQAFLAAVLGRLDRPTRLTVLTGPGEPPPEVKQLWADRPDTTVADLAEAALPGHYAQCDAVLAPSPDTDETLAVLRAMAAGRALLAVDDPAIQDLVSTTRNGMLARAGDADEWVDKLDYLLSGAALRLHLGRGARARAEAQFALPRTLGRLESRLAALTRSWNYLDHSATDEGEMW
ncbi:hypothetical protein Acy02nite_88970 [Actinoplanes cyaneus]|uniref:Glycosyltransferase n=1 Tax=Actinoplanes cyaneus TaxID=52696 RepID=A0A919MH85_9ACTN|nr:glycosyltransferase family 4 protein [Actinoplanes cyaneus]MCW2144271.1 Glycosyltransferase involved in cell wall bisynthesis [Actinoplanes cyaneus]GID71016.1 hypothetical protein Acy02nite_88970 [Actinoplanes cyaneus]